MPNSDHQLRLLQICIHGLIRNHDLELGRDADTGGQTKYVVDVTKALAQHENVSHVDLVTRQIIDPEIGDDYVPEIESLSDNANIIRIYSGSDSYLPKEALWDYLDIFSDNLLNWLQKQPLKPDLIHTHYADGGYVGVKISNSTGIPLVHTGHSLGRDKRRRLLAKGLTEEVINQRYNMNRRIDAEEEILAHAKMVITSTNNEIEDQYELYDYYQPDRMEVIPPGVNLEQFFPSKQKVTSSPVFGQIDAFLKDPSKPIILALSRADERKNIISLLEAFGETPELRSKANLVIIAGNRTDIRELESGAKSVLKELLIASDAHNLYGNIALPKQHEPEEVPELYRLAAATKGIFVNPALTEPFGLTILEAAASGLPIVSTENGGPVDIIANCHNGLLVDPLDKPAIAAALLKILNSSSLWQKYSKNGLLGVSKHYAWAAHVENYLQKIRPIIDEGTSIQETAKPRRPARHHDRAIFSDIDQSLLGDKEGLKQLVGLIRSNRSKFTFGIATGRQLDSAIAILKKNNIPLPDVLITSLGTRIFYAPKFTLDEAWSEHIDHLWNPKSIRRILSNLPGLTPQGRNQQSFYKISYHIDPNEAPHVDEINALLRQKDQTVNVIQSFGQYLDIVPSRASKGFALRYVMQKWKIPLEKCLVAGGSGADEDMMRGNTHAVVVANRHHEELNILDEQTGIYFAEKPYAAGIVEAIEHYDFFNTDIH